MNPRKRRPGSRGASNLVVLSKPSVAPVRRASEIERLFARGRYADVIASTVDAPEFDARNEPQLGHVAASLAATGRLDDADALLGRVPDTDERELCIARFFIAVAYCRAGDFRHAERLFLENYRSWRRRWTDPERRFYALQGLSCIRYFSGSMQRAEWLARRALQAAFAADSALGRVLATDIQGHAWVQMGQVKRGLALLQRAKELAESVELDAHAAAIQFSCTMYEARFGTRGIFAALERLAELSSESVHDSYSVRLVALDRALLMAFAGQSDAALAQLRSVDQQVIPEGDRRMQIRLLLTAALVTTLRDGQAAGRALVTAAEALLHDDWDRALRVEVLCAKAWCAAPEERRTLAAELERAARSTAIARASLFAHLLEPTFKLPASVSLHDFEDDRLGALLLSVLHDHHLPRLLREQYLGLVPRALGLTPGRRIYLIEPGHILVENHGNVTFERPGETSLKLLRALADGQWWSKEALLAAVWGIATYRPDRHDSVVYMAVTRARQALGGCRDWLENEHGAYRLTGTECRILPWRDEIHGFDARAAPLAAASVRPTRAAETLSPSLNDGSTAALAFVQEHGQATTGRLAKALQVSEMTALRELQKLVANGVLRRIGRGRATRYEMQES